MTIEQEKIGKSKVVLSLSGRLDTANAPILERKIKQWGDDITELVLDFAQLTYISSMGLRVLLQAKKTLRAESRKLIILNMNDSVREVFEITGFLNLMVQEEKFVVIRGQETDAVVLSLNGQIELEHIPMVSKELFEIRENCTQESRPVAVILDMEKLSDFAPAAIRHLSQAIADTAWDGRTLRVRGALPKIQTMLRGEGMGDLLETEN